MEEFLELHCKSHVRQLSQINKMNHFCSANCNVTVSVNYQSSLFNKFSKTAVHGEPRVHVKNPNIENLLKRPTNSFWIYEGKLIII